MLCGDSSDYFLLSQVKQAADQTWQAYQEILFSIEMLQTWALKSYQTV